MLLPDATEYVTKIKLSTVEYPCVPVFTCYVLYVKVCGSDFTHNGIICRLGRRKRDITTFGLAGKLSFQDENNRKKDTMVKSELFPDSRDCFSTAVESSVAEIGKMEISLHLLYKENYPSFRAKAEV